MNEIKLVCFNNKCRTGYGYLSDATFELTIGKIYTFDKNHLLNSGVDPYRSHNYGRVDNKGFILPSMDGHALISDDNSNLINIVIFRNFFETIESNRDKKLKELGIQ